MFDVLRASAIGALMARMNRYAEIEAVERLAPAPADAVLVIGFGPGRPRQRRPAARTSPAGACLRLSLPV